MVYMERNLDFCVGKETLSKARKIVFMRIMWQYGDHIIFVFVLNVYNAYNLHVFSSHKATILNNILVFEVQVKLKRGCMSEHPLL